MRRIPVWRVLLVGRETGSPGGRGRGSWIGRFEALVTEDAGDDPGHLADLLYQLGQVGEFGKISDADRVYPVVHHFLIPIDSQFRHIRPSHSPAYPECPGGA